MPRYTISVRHNDEGFWWTDKDPATARSWWGEYKDLRGVRIAVRRHWHHRPADDFAFVLLPSTATAGA
jgi:hypothetical protein